jgi:hypothetical protein
MYDSTKWSCCTSSLKIDKNLKDPGFAPEPGKTKKLFMIPRENAMVQ